MCSSCASPQAAAGIEEAAEDTPLCWVCPGGHRVPEEVVTEQPAWRRRIWKAEVKPWPPGLATGKASESPDDLGMGSHC